MSWASRKGKVWISLAKIYVIFLDIIWGPNDSGRERYFFAGEVLLTGKCKSRARYSSQEKCNSREKYNFFAFYYKFLQVKNIIINYFVNIHKVLSFIITVHKHETNCLLICQVSGYKCACLSLMAEVGACAFSCFVLASMKPEKNGEVKKKCDTNRQHLKQTIKCEEALYPCFDASLKAWSQSPRALGSHFLKVLSWQSCMGVLSWQSWLSFLAVLFRLFLSGCPFWSVLFGCPVPAFLSRLSCPACPTLTVLSRLSRSDCPVLAIIL